MSDVIADDPPPAEEGTAVECRAFTLKAGKLETLPTADAVAAIRQFPRSLNASLAGNFVWLDIARPTAVEGEILRDQLDFHPLAVEDVLHGRQRPKVDRYPGYFFVVFYTARVHDKRKRVSLCELHLFVGNNFLVTVRDREIPELDEVIALWKRSPRRIRDAGSATHALLDAIVDGYFGIVQHFSDKLDALETEVYADDKEASVNPAFELRQEMVVMRRILGPQRDVLSSLLRHDVPFLVPEFMPYFQDVYDHLLRVTEEIDTFRDLVTGVIEIHSSHIAKRLNQTMQTLTAWSIILMSIAVIAGIYGMNFHYMPELALTWGYFGSLGLMFAVGAGLLVYFRRNSWL